MCYLISSTFTTTAKLSLERSLVMKEVKDISVRSYRPLIKAPTGNPGETYYATLVSHQELDNLIGRLMQMCDLTGDIEQRKALKDTIKRLTREWLDSLYEESGYDKWTGIKESVEPIII